MNIAQRCSAQANCRRHIAKSALHQNHICCINGNVCSGADRNTHISSGQSRCIVNAISNHGNLTILLQASDNRFFAIRKHSGDHLIYADLITNCFRSAFIITGQHNDPQSHTLHLFNSRKTVFLDHICNCDNTKQFAIFCKKEWCLTLTRQAVRYQCDQFFLLCRTTRGWRN